MSRTKHSQKTLTTITEMQTSPEDWGVCDFTVRTETRDMMLPCKCADCHGKGYTYDYYCKTEDYNTVATRDLRTYTIDEMWEEAGLPSTKEMGHFSYTRDENGERQGDTRWNVLNNVNRSLARDNGFRNLSNWPCKTCANGKMMRNRNGFTAPRSTGYVRRMFYDVKCNIHQAAWPQGTDHSSRYHGADCEACNKNNIKTGTYPVLAQRTDGTHTGMWVGNACIHKFGLKKFKTTDEQAKSWADKGSKGDLVVDLYVRGYEATSAVVTEEE